MATDDVSIEFVKQIKTLDGERVPGEIVSVSGRDARRWIRSGYAQASDAQSPESTESTPESSESERSSSGTKTSPAKPRARSRKTS